MFWELRKEAINCHPHNLVYLWRMLIIKSLFFFNTIFIYVIHLFLLCSIIDISLIAATKWSLLTVYSLFWTAH